MTAFLVDTSVLVKWFHTDGEDQVAEARAIRDAQIADEIDTHVLDLAIYELGNVLVRALRWSAQDVSDQLDDLLTVCGPPIPFEPAWIADASTLAEEHRLSFYDAAWAASARALTIPLVSADRTLLRSLLAISPSAAASRITRT